MLLMNLEARPVVFEDVGRQVLATGKRKPPSFFINEIGTSFLKVINSFQFASVTGSILCHVLLLDLQLRILLCGPWSFFKIYLWLSVHSL